MSTLISMIPHMELKCFGPREKLPAVGAAICILLQLLDLMLKRLTRWREELTMHNLMSEKTGKKTERSVADFALMIPIFMRTHVQRHNSLVSELSTAHRTRDLHARARTSTVYRLCNAGPKPYINALTRTLLMMRVSS